MINKSEDNFHNIIEKSADAIVIVSKKGVILFVNPSAELLFNRKAEELTGELFGFPLVSGERTDIQILRSSKEMYFAEMRVVETEWEEEDAYLSTIRDITERIKLEEALRESEEKFSKISSTANDAIIMMDNEGRISYWNEAAEKTFGYSTQEILGRNLHKILVPQHYYKIFEKGFKRFKMTGEGAAIGKRLELNAIRKDGIEFPMELSLSAVNIKGKWNAIGIIRDTTERKKMEEELFKSSKLESMGILAGGIAHDFNNLLTAILGNITLAKMYSNPEDNPYKRLVEAEKAAERAKDLTQQLLTFSRGGKPVKKTVSIAGLIKDSAEFALRGSNIKCDFSITDVLWPVEVDEGQISQVINNIVINAQQALTDGGTIQVHAENINVNEEPVLPLDDGRYVKITIKDQGIGIQKEHLPKIFDPFFTTKEKGNGLGLASSYSIIINHDGLITAESEPEIGATFYIYLTASQKEVEMKEKIDESPLIGNGRILVMDDEEIIRNVAGEMIRSIGYEVELAKDGSEAIELYKKSKETGQPFDAIIMDLTIKGGMGGKETIKKLLEIDPDVKAIVSSGYSHDPIMADYKQYGFKGVMTKPYKIKELSEILQKIKR